MNDKDVINAFIEHLRTMGYKDTKVDKWPDSENRITTDIDATAGIFAIEHTSIDTISNQRERSDWFMKAIGDIEKDIGVLLPYRLQIAVEYSAVQKGQKWCNIKDALRRWIMTNSVNLSYGYTINEVPGVPFHILSWKWTSRNPGVFFSRLEPTDHSLPERIRELFDRKAKKLSRYQSEYTTLLLVENGDIALMNMFLLIDGISKAYPNGLPSGVDQLWYVDTSISEYIEFMDLTFEIRQRSMACC